MNADYAFWIGATHQVCQDYALALSWDAAAGAVLADGCSSSPDTDSGARLLARSAARLLPNIGAEPEAWANCHREAASAAAECAEHLGLPLSCLDATLMTLKAEDGVFTSAVSGDGIVALGRHDGTADIYEISFAANAPRYAAYWLDDSRRRLWDALPGNAKTVRRWHLTGAGLTETETRDSQSAVEVFAGTAAEYRFAAVLSDGVQSFAETVQTETAKTTQPVTLAEVLAGLLAFKGGQGQFALRRTTAFRRDCRRRNWQAADDVSLAAVWLSE